MAFFQWLKRHIKKTGPENTIEELDDDDWRQEEETTETCYNIEETHHDRAKLIYFASTIPNQNVIDILSTSHKDVRVSLRYNSFFLLFIVKTFADESECVDYMKSITDKILLIIDGQPSK